MTVFEAASALPNGLHDAVLKKCSIDFGVGTAVFEIDAWIGDVDAEEKEERECYRPIELRLSGLIYLNLSPGEDWHLRSIEPSRIDLCEADESSYPQVRGLVEYFKARFYIEDRNSFLDFAASDALITTL